MAAMVVILTPQAVESPRIQTETAVLLGTARPVTRERPSAASQSPRTQLLAPLRPHMEVEAAALLQLLLPLQTLSFLALAAAAA